MVTDEQRAELQRLAQEWEAKLRPYIKASEKELERLEREDWEARVRLYMEASEDCIELAEYLEEETRG